MIILTENYILMRKMQGHNCTNIRSCKRIIILTNIESDRLSLLQTSDNINDNNIYINKSRRSLEDDKYNVNKDIQLLGNFIQIASFMLPKVIYGYSQRGNINTNWKRSNSSTCHVRNDL